MGTATITMLAKAAATALADEKVRKTAQWIIAAILSPTILIIVVICSLLSGSADHNNNAVDLCFNGAESLCGGGGEGHSGLDMGAGKGFPIQAARRGVVSYVKNSGSAGYGYHIVVDHGDAESPGGRMVTLYGHCSKVYAKSGQQVSQGDVIAAVGSTGRSCATQACHWKSSAL